MNPVASGGTGKIENTVFLEISARIRIISKLSVGERKAKIKS